MNSVDVTQQENTVTITQPENAVTITTPSLTLDITDINVGIYQMFIQAAYPAEFLKEADD